MPAPRADPWRAHFLGIARGKMDGHAVEVHACVLTDNHYHLLVRTPQTNLSDSLDRRALQRLVESAPLPEVRMRRNCHRVVRAVETAAGEGSQEFMVRKRFEQRLVKESRLRHLAHRLLAGSQYET